MERCSDLELPWRLAPNQRIAGLLASSEEVTQRTRELGGQLLEKFYDSNPLFLVLMAGGNPFGTMLTRTLVDLDPTFHPDVDYITISSYGKATEPGKLRLVMGIRPEYQDEVAGRPVIAIDDVIDWGHTAAYTEKYARSLGAASFDLVALVQKRNDRETYASASYYAFESPRETWLTGMGMDNGPAGKEANRWLPAVAIIEPLS